MSPARILEAMTQILEQGVQREAANLEQKQQPLSDRSNSLHGTNRGSPPPKRRRIHP
jgi:hypothetical protein